MKTLSKLILIIFFVLGMAGIAASDVSDILEAYFEAVGGLARLSEIRTVKRVANAQLTQFNGLSVNIPGIVEEAIVVGKKSYVKRHFSGFGDTIVWNGTAGWKSTLGGGTISLPVSELKNAKNGFYINPFQAIYEQGGSSAFEQGEDEKFQSKECLVIQIIGVKDVFYYIDKASNLLAGIKAPNTDPNFGGATVVVHYTDYSEYGGVMLPDSRKIFIGNDALTVNYTFTKTEIDVELDETIFQKP